MNYNETPKIIPVVLLQKSLKTSFGPMEIHRTLATRSYVSEILPNPVPAAAKCRQLPPITACYHPKK